MRKKTVLVIGVRNTSPKDTKDYFAFVYEGPLSDLPNQKSSRFCLDLRDFFEENRSSISVVHPLREEKVTLTCLSMLIDFFIIQRKFVYVTLLRRKLVSKNRYARYECTLSRQAIRSLFGY